MPIVEPSCGAFNISASGSSFRSDGLYDFNSGYRNNVGSVRVGVDGGRKGAAAFTARYGDAVGHFPTDGNGVPVDHNQYTVDRTTGARTARPSTQVYARVARTGIVTKKDIDAQPPYAPPAYCE